MSRLCVTLAFLSCTSMLLATTFIVVKTRKQIVVGVDSLISGHFGHKFIDCKIIQVDQRFTQRPALSSGLFIWQV
jgi:hypothetical protein